MVGKPVRRFHANLLDVDETSLVALRDAFKTSMNRHLETIDNLILEDFDKMWTSKVSGNQYSYKWLLYHFVEHIATHRGQVAMALRIFKED